MSNKLNSLVQIEHHATEFAKLSVQCVMRENTIFTYSNVEKVELHENCVLVTTQLSKTYLAATDIVSLKVTFTYPYNDD